MTRSWTWIAVLSIALAGCAQKTTNASGLELLTQSGFESVIDRYTDRSQKYEGLYNTIDLTATLRTSAVLRAQAEQQARIYQWDAAKLRAETNKLSEKARFETEVFLDFYTPERKNDDLARSSSQWRTYLEVNGRRWEGKVAKLRLSGSELHGLYPYHSRFATPYAVTFPVAVSTVEGKPAKFTITGPMGMATLHFNP